MTEDGMCVVTHPLGPAGENATRTLLDILSAITTVCLVTADLPTDSSIRDRHEIVEIAGDGGKANVAVVAGRFLTNQLRIARVIAGREERTILFFGATSYVIPIAVAKLLGRTVIIEPRGDVPLTLKLTWGKRMPASVAWLLALVVRMLERTGFRLADGIITYTPGMAEQLNLRIFGGKLYTNGARYVDTRRFSPSIPYGQRETIVGYVGRLDEEKGVRKLGEAVALLPEEISFRLVGDGDLRPWLQKFLADRISAGEVELKDWVDHDAVPGELSQLRLLVLPSSPTEGLPTTILEAFACGTPVYAAPVSGVPDIVREGETGFLMEATEPQEIADEIERILSRDDLGTVSTAGRELVEEEYCFEAAFDRYRTILESIN